MINFQIYQKFITKGYIIKVRKLSLLSLKVKYWLMQAFFLLFFIWLSWRKNDSQKWNRKILNFNLKILSIIMIINEEKKGKEYFHFVIRPIFQKFFLKMMQIWWLPDNNEMIMEWKMIRDSQTDWLLSLNIAVKYDNDNDNVDNSDGISK